MDKLKLLSEIFDEKTINVIVKILEKDDIFYLRDISRESGVSLATTYRIVQKLAKVGLVKKDSLDKFTYYKVLKNSSVHDELSALLMGKKTDAFNMFKNRIIEKVPSVKLYAVKDNKDKKIFIVGKGISEMFVKEISRDIFDKTGTKINSLVLTPEKFDQMKEIGLISQEKEL